MQSIQKHIIRIYDQERGYCLYGGASSSLVPHPLDYESSEISKSYLIAQKRLDDVLSTKKVSWSMAFAHDGLVPIVAYGSSIELPVKHGQSAIIFIHAVQLKRSAGLYSYVEAVVKCLSNVGIRRLRRTIMKVATGTAKADEGATQIAKEFERSLEKTTRNYQMDGFAVGRQIKCIEHDCAGASSLAWQILALQQASADPPWEVFDIIRNEESVATTVNILQGQVLLASEIQREALLQYRSPKSVPAPANSAAIGGIEGDPHPAESKGAAQTIPDSDADELVSTTQLAVLPRQKISLSRRVPIYIFIICIGIYLIYRSDHQQRHALDLLNKIAEKGVTKQSIQQNPEALINRGSNPAAQPQKQLDVGPVQVASNNQEVLNAEIASVAFRKFFDKVFQSF